ncbi:MAG: aminotransferase class I/II-fold pyridoxal phosphate-dependent enzyme [Holophaga sp.]|nr:aminotransferase class I/II-fold pyridoxal phosphate-dependent enzyme [Holophaga sp.]
MFSETIHGGRLHAALRDLSLKPGAILDFSANLNPMGPPASVLEALRGALPGELAAYPDAEAPALRRLLCGRHGARDRNLVLGSGGAALLFLALRALAPERVLLPEPCFREQPRAIRGAGGEVVSHPMAGLSLDLATLVPEERGCDAVLLTHPHNPTGHLLPARALLDWITAHPRLALVLDEAFMDYHPEESLVQALLERPRTVILRSLTKFYGMPGLRVGYGFADPATADRMRELQEAWPVGQLELLAAQAALEDEAYASATLAAFRVDSARFRAALAERPWIEVLPGAAPFVLVRLPGASGTALAGRLREKGLLVRMCAHWPGLGDSYLRLAVRGPGDQDRLLDAMDECLGGMS